MAWVYLLVAGILEVAWAFAMKQSVGFTRLIPTGIMVVSMVGSFALLALAMRTLPLGLSYMIWTGIGAIGAFLVGVFFLGEPVSPMRLIAVILVVSGIAAMRLAP